MTACSAIIVFHEVWDYYSNAGGEKIYMKSRGSFLHKAV